MKIKFSNLIALLGLTGGAVAAFAAGPVTQLKAEARAGQVFLTWKEAATPAGTTFNVYLADKPIADLTQAKRIAHHLEQHSARDWWEDPASFKKDAKPGKPIGFLLGDEGQRRDPADGLFVHTVRKDAAGKLFFAVTPTDAQGKEDPAVALGENSLAQGVPAQPGEIQPIWQHDAPPPPPGAAKGKGLWLDIHAKGGVIANSEYLLFGDDTMGWREGLPFKFNAHVEGDLLIVRPTDRVWINRPHDEAKDGGMPAIWTFWYGYNSNIYDRAAMAQGAPVNYTERRNLWLLSWLSRYYQTDPQRWYCSGSSMGGCGTLSFGFRHPELFAACHARVPIVAYTYAPGPNQACSATRLEPCCWAGPIGPDLKTSEGVPLLERMNATKFVSETKADLPFLYLINGRQDGSIPWPNNPPFYQAMTKAQQGFAAYWDNGSHSSCGKDAPKDIQDWYQRFRRQRADQAYPAFTHTSTDRNPGNGDPANGDIIGWINRGMDWKEIEDTQSKFAITLLAAYPGIEYPVRTDVTLRRVQAFKTNPGERVRARIGNLPPVSITADANGRLTIPNLTIPDKNGARVTLSK